MPPRRPVGAAPFLARALPEPYETLLGDEETHHLLAAAHADRACPPDEHWISWEDCYASADLLPLPRKASLLLDARGHALPVPEHLTGQDSVRAVEAGRAAERIRRQAHLLGVDL
ncbi:hypothetical protein [Streptomyces sp. URMC 125]|uniref:hypothetical protein n=1 Tax=Streptomyces sp. URMC 125 TaxID=3423419 RepID=UPI003F1B7968